MKRTFDFISSIIGLLAIAPLISAIGIVLRLVDGSPVFFRQSRVGRGGRDFVLYKFRTMNVAAGTEKGSFDAGSTRRVTGIGRFLRKTKLDELPQLWNTLKGDMSLVGPRPEVRKWVDIYPERWARVLTIRPGITDPASVLYRNEEDILTRSADPERTYRDEVLPHKLSLYEEYVANQTFRGDIDILLQTFGAVVGIPSINKRGSSIDDRA